MRHRPLHQRFLAVLLAPALALALVAGCQGGSDTSPPLVPPANPTQQARVLTDIAEGKYLPLMSADLGQQVRQQAWFTQLTQSHVDLIETLLRCERAAKARGEEVSVRDMLAYASEQDWYGDGLDEGEARSLKGVFEAYTESLSNRYAPTIGTVLSSTLRYGMFLAVDLPEGGEMMLVVSADDPAVGQGVIDMAVAELPRIEKLVGAYPYSFLHIMVTPLGELYAGLSYDQFIAISPDSVDQQTMVHELTHSTMYGSFPIWFEEGFAHFVEYYLTDSLDEGVARHHRDLSYVRSDSRLHVGVYRDNSFEGYIAERAQGFLFMKAVFDLNGIEGVTDAVRSLRTKSLGDQELLRAFAQHGTPEQQKRMAAYFCDSVRGTTRNYCAPTGPF